MQHVFLICSERSGSNLITRLLDAHPDVCGPPPSHLVRLLAGHANRYGDLADEREWERLLHDAVALLETSLAPWSVAWSVADLRRRVPVRSLGALVRTVVEAEAEAHGAGTLFLKENRLARFLPFVLHTFPEARFVAMVRDPRDMALSWKRSAVLRGDVVRAAHVWREDQAALLDLLAQFPRGRNLHLLTYEDLVRDTAGALADVCAFLRLPAEPAMLEFHRGDAARDAAAVSSAWRNLAQPVLADNTGRWRRELDADEAAYVEHVGGPLLTAFGYAPEGPPPPDPVALEARLRARERHEKPEYAHVPAAERALRARRAAVEHRLAAAPLAAVREPRPAPCVGGA